MSLLGDVADSPKKAQELQEAEDELIKRLKLEGSVKRIDVYKAILGRIESLENESA